MSHILNKLLNVSQRRRVNTVKHLQLNKAVSQTDEPVLQWVSQMEVVIISDRLLQSNCIRAGPFAWWSIHKHFSPKGKEEQDINICC